uniref:Uncharacterized protein n=1 Tax=Hyaloperonospora arabidopsidis (strain Emoy2) TaxID=559515 RepID=M4BNK4_HYAAE
MTQIGVSKDRRPNSHFGGMREKSLRELKEQQLALCIEQVGTNAVPQHNRHRTQQDLTCCYPSVRTVTGAHQSSACYLVVSQTPRAATHTHGQTAIVTQHSLHQQQELTCCYRCSQTVLCPSGSRRSRARRICATGTWLARNMRTSARGRILRRERTIGKNGAFWTTRVAVV